MTTERSLSVAFFKSAKDTRPDQRHMSWTDLASTLTAHNERQVKDGPAWSPAEYRPNTTRGSRNVASISAAVADLDGVDWDAFADQLDGYEFLVHSTYSHASQSPHHRVVLPLLTPIPADQWSGAFAQFSTVFFDGRNDPQTKDAARLYYLPACRPTAPRLAYRQSGKWLDLGALPPGPPPRRTFGGCPYWPANPN